MRIAILTQPLGKNYGGILQAYALQQVLSHWGHEVIILNRQDNYPSFKLLVWRLASFLKCLIKRYIKGDPNVLLISPLSLDYITDIRLRYDYSDLEKFISKYIVQTSVIRSSSQLRKVLSRDHYDCLIVGSDQVWRENYSPCITDYFGGFLENIDNLTIMSYAASFGVDRQPISREKEQLCKDLIRKFKAISVRENSAVELLRSSWNVESELVLDPTLLLDREHYERFCQKPDHHRGLFCYVLDPTNIKNDIVLKVSECLGLKVNTISIYPVDANGNASKLVSIESWLSNICYSDFVVTDSFHGCVFSIIFNKPFIVIANKERGLDRFATILDNLNLHHRLIESISQLSDNLLFEEIDYLRVNEILLHSRRNSLNYLIDVLKHDGVSNCSNL